MSKHIFLTGAVQSGKSTVLQKVLDSLDMAVGGFRSGSGPTRYDQERWLYLWDASDAPVYDAAHQVAHITPEARQAFPERFNTLGCEILHRAQTSGVDLILMDECGFLEREALEFQTEVLRTLDGSIPVLGVVRLRSSGWTDAIRCHPNVTLISVTDDNRDSLPDEIISLLQKKL